MKSAISLVALVLALSFMSSILVGEKYRWYIIKGKDAVCKVIQADTKIRQLSQDHTMTSHCQTLEARDGQRG